MSRKNGEMVLIFTKGGSETETCKSAEESKEKHYA
jgi:hypothetical protein